VLSGSYIVGRKEAGAESGWNVEKWLALLKSEIQVEVEEMAKRVERTAQQPPRLCWEETRGVWILDTSGLGRSAAQLLKAVFNVASSPQDEEMISSELAIQSSVCNNLLLDS
jgi:hypothetical protein